ncbi:MAG: hypothetical protein ACSHXK_09280 [Oceanococcus sp.]
MACTGRSTVNPKPYLLSLALCASSVLWGNFAHALSIGSPQFDSGLSQALQVRIPIRGFAAGTHAQDYTINALPSSAYAKLGLVMPPYPMHELNFRWLNVTSTGAEILISSDRRISEPVINILLEVRGPGRRWVKQIDLLLDPLTQDLTAASSRSTASNRRLDTSQQYGPVQAGEVLSVIAQKLRPQRQIPLVQMAQAIIDANPSAFPAGPESLRAGVILQVPQRSAIERAALNSQIMQPTAQTAAKQNSAATKASTDAAFLPSYRYAQGVMYPLSMVFLSYAAIKPIDLKRHLIALEQSEPVRFRADWTLSSAPNLTTPSKFLSPVNSTTLLKQQTPQAPTIDAAARVETLKQLRAEQNPQTQDKTDLTQLGTKTLNAVPEQATQNLNTAVQATPAQVKQPNEAEDTRWWLWLCGIVIALLLYRWQQNRSLKQQQLTPRVPYNKKTSQTAPQPANKSASAQATPPTPLISKASNNAKPSDSETLENSSNADEAVSEQEEQQLRRDIRALLNSNLPSEAERKLKIAEALSERGNLSRAQQMVSEVQEALSKL